MLIFSAIFCVHPYMAMLWSERSYFPLVSLWQSGPKLANARCQNAIPIKICGKNRAYHKRTYSGMFLSLIPVLNFLKLIDKIDGRFE